MMIEVFKTNVKQRRHAAMLLNRIHKTFTCCKANFDLDDCDKIMRIQCSANTLSIAGLVDLLKELGFTAEVLPGDNNLYNPQQ